MKRYIRSSVSYLYVKDVEGNQYRLRDDGVGQSISRVAPYDDQDYFWAKCIGDDWAIINSQGRRCEIVKTCGDDETDLQMVIEALHRRNKDLEPRMMYN